MNTLETEWHAWYVIGMEESNDLAWILLGGGGAHSGKIRIVYRAEKYVMSGELIWILNVGFGIMCELSNCSNAVLHVMMML